VMSNTIEKPVPKNSDIICRICGEKQEELRQFCCRACWLRLPRELQAQLVTQQLMCLAWLREHAANLLTDHATMNPEEMMCQLRSRFYDQLTELVLSTANSWFENKGVERGRISRVMMAELISMAIDDFGVVLDPEQRRNLICEIVNERLRSHH
jgi:hypothetical protein